jgi:hypothetical protein
MNRVVDLSDVELNGAKYRIFNVSLTSHVVKWDKSSPVVSVFVLRDNLSVLFISK